MSFCHHLVATGLTCRGGYGNGSPEARSFKAAVNLTEQDKLPQTTQPEAEDNQPGRQNHRQGSRTIKSRTHPTGTGRCFRPPKMTAPGAFAFCKIKRIPPHPQEERKDGSTICPATETGVLFTGRMYRITMECAEIRLRYISEMSFAKLVCDTPYFLTYR
ncbi:hypothetical protein PAL_GLEAN10017223 [Pteropus alecto]|uniref:Uncharacterized protein n=1 Tax=Pteropus alecto TaxID=9402 RepID=L5KKR1_PTEAL|nr:hypothetical protein PAL_GLEAN10017223 [Pteropus alecto]